MISLTTLQSSAQSVWQRVQTNAGIFLNTYPPIAPPTAGMYTYPIALPGGQRRLHLRIETDGSGVLFIDVTDVIHLNTTAAHMTYMALEGIEINQALGSLVGMYKGVSRHQLQQELARLYNMVDSLHTVDGCPTCALGDVTRTALFSSPVAAPYKVDLALTYGCNNECPHCYNEEDRYDMVSLKKEAWFEVIDKLHAMGVPHLILTGGEATMHPDLPAIIRYADQKGHIVGLNTNGRRIAHQPYMETLAEAGLNHVQVTLGSCHAPVHDAMMGATSFHQTVRGIKNAVASNVHVITNTTLMRPNMDHVEEIIEFIYELGIRTFAMNGMIYSGGGFAHPSAIPESQMAALLIRVRDKAEELGMRFLWYTPTEYCRLSPVELEVGAKRCNAGEYSMCIEPNGDVLPCQSYYVRAGNILHDSWTDIWQSELFRTFRDREDDPRWAGLPEKCWECPDLALCGGGCRIEREARDGNRVAACAGCSTGGNSMHMDQGMIGFIPFASLTNNDKRGQGEMPAFIPLTTLQQ